MSALLIRMHLVALLVLLCRDQLLFASYFRVSSFMCFINICVWTNKLELR